MRSEDIRRVDFGRTATDYARHRPGFPPAFFERLERAGVVAPGRRLLDVGTGTGTLARGFTARDVIVVGLDPSEQMLAQAEALARADGLSVEWARGSAEENGFADQSFDVVSAGQCWHWFDRPKRSPSVGGCSVKAGGC